MMMVRFHTMVVTTCVTRCSCHCLTAAEEKRSNEDENAVSMTSREIIDTRSADGADLPSHPRCRGHLQGWTRLQWLLHEGLPLVSDSRGSGVVALCQNADLAAACNACDAVEELAFQNGCQVPRDGVEACCHCDVQINPPSLIDNSERARAWRPVAKSRISEAPRWALSAVGCQTLPAICF